MKFMSFQSWLAQTIQDDGCCQSENISYLWADPNQEDVLDYFATQYDLNTVRMKDVEFAAEEIYQKTQSAIASDFPDEIQVWRCGGLAGDVTSVTTNKRVAVGGCSGGYYGGKDATVASYMVNRSDVLVSIEHFWPAGDFVEDELLVRPGSLRPMKESLLREYIRESLLSEAARGLTDLRKLGYYVGIKDENDSFEIKLYNSRSKRAMDELGTISAETYDLGGAATCMGAYMINWSSVEEKGWGPLLYDLAMELATSKGSGIMSDRNNVSYKAQNVWRYYMANRGNVEKVQMDDWDNNLTDPKSDNCDQEAAYERGIKGGTFWDSENEETPWDPYGKEVLLKSPTTKMYRWKGMSKIAALKKMGRLFNS